VSTIISTPFVVPTCPRLTIRKPSVLKVVLRMISCREPISAPPAVPKPGIENKKVIGAEGGAENCWKKKTIRFFRDEEIVLFINFVKTFLLLYQKR